MWTDSGGHGARAWLGAGVDRRADLLPSRAPQSPGLPAARLPRSAGEKKGFGWTDYRDLLAAAQRQLGAPLVVVWDSVRTHWMPGLRT
ncbi:hypothetical protein [Streptomyces sviceus]|uniref:hypothetical protein n=1 Tax=Streptomyces TaxID=1883 RepID=UPI0001804146